jgi:small subunit ribosomal protein S13
VRRLTEFIQANYLVGDELKRSVRDSILKLINMKCYRGLRHSAGLPVHGQRTHTNASTARKFRWHLIYDVK